MKIKICRTRFLLALLVLYVGSAHSWDIAVSVGDELMFYTNNTLSSTIRLKSQNLTALAYDEMHNMMLYVNKQTNNDTICGYDLSSIEIKCFTKGGGRNIHGITFDPATDTVFFTDTNERSVNWFSLKPGSENHANGNLLIKMDDGVPRDIAVDSCKGYIYWLNTDFAKPTIERARLNGSEREVFKYITSLPIDKTHNWESHSLVIDQQRQALYWIEPATTREFRLYLSELNKKPKTFVIHYYQTCNPDQYNHPSNTLTVTKNSFISIGFCSDERRVLKYPKNFAEITTIFKVQTKNSPVGIVANYKIIDQIQGRDCEALMIRVKTAAEYDGPFCVHGVKDKGHSICTCEPGYTSERCDVSVCVNYCMQGNCSINGEGLPECRCDVGYSGVRCEVNACHGYCLNDGDCSLDEEFEPFCQCDDSYEGTRCEANKNSSLTTTSTSCAEERNKTLAFLKTFLNC